LQLGSSNNGRLPDAIDRIGDSLGNQGRQTLSANLDAGLVDIAEGKYASFEVITWRLEGIAAADSLELPIWFLSTWPEYSASLS
jgi:hypothetical protein